jgi:hypothetical protein
VGSGTTTRLGLTFDGTSLTSYKNNVAATPHTAAVALQQSLFAFCVGNPFYNDIQVMYDGTIYEVIVFKSALGGTSRSGAETYLQRWV